MKKRLLTILLCLTLVAAVFAPSTAWAGTTPEAFGTTRTTVITGTTYTIGSEAELKYLASFSKDYKGDMHGICFVLTDDIAVTGGAWTPIGSASYGFNAAFYGQNHTISGLNIQGSFTGLFGNTTGIVADLNVSGTITGASYAGGIAGSNGGIIQNCTSSVTYSSTSSGHTNIGGIAGLNAGTLQNCTNTGSITGYLSGTDGDTDVGGVTGYNSGKVINCGNTADVKGQSGIGGIAGADQGAIIRNCYNTGNVTGSMICGGIVGISNYTSGKMANCINTGTVTASQNSGGISGELVGSAENCFWLSGTCSKGNGVGAPTLTNFCPFSGTDTLAAAAGSTTSLLTAVKNYAAANSSYDLLSWASSGSYPGLTGLIVTKQPDNADYSEGNTADFTALAVGHAVSYQWQVSADGDTWSDVSNGSGGTTPTYTTPAMTTAMSGAQYRCLAKSGGTEIYTDAAALGTCAKPEITDQPHDIDAYAGGYASFNVTASGTPEPTYQWQVSKNNGSTWSYLTEDDGYGGITDTTLSVSVTKDMDGYQYRCVASNNMGKSTSDAATLTIIKGADSFDIVSTDVVKGKTYIITEAQGLAKLAELVNGGKDCTGVTFLLDQDIPILNYYDFDKTTDGNWTPIGNTSHPFNGTFYGMGHTVSELNLQFAEYSGLFGAIGSNGVIQDVAVSGSMTGASFAGGIAGKNSGTIVNCVSAVAYTNAATTAHRRIGGIAGENGGTVQNCTSSGALAGYQDSTNHKGDSYIGGIAGYNSGAILNSGNTGNVTGDAYTGGIAGGTESASTATVIRNCYNRGDVNGYLAAGGITGKLYQNNHMENCCNAGNITVASGGSHFAGIAGEIGSGSTIANCYWLAGSCTNGGAGDADGSAVLTNIVSFTGDTLSSSVGSATSLLTALNDYVTSNTAYKLRPWKSSTYPILTDTVIVAEPADAYVKAGSAATFSVQAAGVSLDYQWQVKKDSESGWTDVSADYGGRTPTYTVPEMKDSLVGSQYRCRVTDSDGSVETAAASLAYAVAPKITKQPESLIAARGSDASVSVTATGAPTPSCQWYIQKKGKTTWETAGTGATCVLTMSDEIDGAKLYCAVSNPSGNVNSDVITLNLPVAADVTSQPKDKTVAAGSTATFTVSAIGLPVPVYKWQVSTDAGATWNDVTSGTGKNTASYTTGAVTMDMTGYQYRCVVSNDKTDTSNVATLTVTPPKATYTVGAVASAGGSVSGGGSYTDGTPVTLRATANAGYVFTGWYNGSKLVFANASYTFTVNGNITLTAKFEKAKVTITAVSGNLAFGSATGGGTYSPGATVTLKAAAKTGYYFTGWYNDGTLVAVNASYVFKASANMVLTAQFDRVGIPASITAKAAAYDKINLSWGAVKNAKGYRVYRSTSQKGTYKLIMTVSSKSFTDSGLKTGTTYYYKINAYIKSGSKTVYGKYYSWTASAKPMLGKVTGVKAASASSTSLKITWKALAGASQYEVWRSATGKGDYKLVKITPSCTFKNTGLKAKTKYYYMIRAYRSVSGGKAYGDYSAVATGKP